MAAAAGALALGAAALNWRDDILRTGLDPKTPFQTYRPPTAPDYASPQAWALIPGHPGAPSPAEGPADVFFVHSTTYLGGRDWNGSVSPKAPGSALLNRVVLPNYAAPFARAGRVFAPRYRQASLYATQMTLRDDARESRTFAYRDVRAAFDAWRVRWGGNRPFVLVGVEQGGQLVERLAREVQADPALRERLVAVYQIETVARGDRLPAACRSRTEVGCRIAYISAREGDFTAPARLLDRALVWSDDDRVLEDLHGRPVMCVNPLTGAAGGSAAQKANLGAANATGLEWGVRPAFLAHQASASCDAGVLRIGAQHSPDLKRSGSWTDRLMVRPFNLFWADLEADALARRDAWLAAHRAP
ncbi:DUF3089 domain-containing protein [soil metagenome]